MLNPLRDMQDECPVAYCGGCRGEVYHNEAMIRYEGRWICSDCFQTAIEKILRENLPLLAQEMQLDTISL